MPHDQAPDEPLDDEDLVWFEYLCDLLNRIDDQVADDLGRPRATGHARWQVMGP